MAKYIFTKDYTVTNQSTAVNQPNGTPQLGGIPSPNIIIKKGIILEGGEIKNFGNNTAYVKFTIPKSDKSFSIQTVDPSAKLLPPPFELYVEPKQNAQALEQTNEKSYVVKGDFNLGEQTNDIGVRTPVKITKGQLVKGKIISRFVFNKNTDGIEYKIPSKNTKIGGFETFFIPLDMLDANELKTGTSNSSETSQKKQPFFTTKNIVIGTLLVAGVIGLFKWQKVI